MGQLPPGSQGKLRNGMEHQALLWCPAGWGDPLSAQPCWLGATAQVCQPAGQGRANESPWEMKSL